MFLVSYILNSNISISILKNIGINHINDEIRNLCKGKLVAAIANYFAYQQDPISHIFFSIQKTLSGQYTPQFVSNKKALIILDDLNVPAALHNTIPLGNKFIYSGRTNKMQTSDLKNAINSLPIHPDISIPLKMEVQKLHFDSPRRCLKHNDNFDKTTAYLRRCLFTSNKFLACTTDLYVVAADKGNVNVIMSKHSYLKKMKQHIDDGIENGIYMHTTDNMQIDSILQIKYKYAQFLYKQWLNKDSGHGIKLNNSLWASTLSQCTVPLRFTKRACPSDSLWLT